MSQTWSSVAWTNRSRSPADPGPLPILPHTTSHQRCTTGSLPAMAAATATSSLVLAKLGPLSADSGVASVHAARFKVVEAGGLRRPQRCLVIRSSKADGQGLRRPAAPPLSPTPPVPPTPAAPPPPSSSVAPAPTTPSPAPSTSSPSVPPVSSASTSGVTVEFQRQMAKELQEYLLDKKFEEEVEKGRILGWTRKNEITNGRWTMFGIAVGLLTEYATGSSFIDQLKIIVSNLGILDLD